MAGLSQNFKVLGWLSCLTPVWLKSCSTVHWLRHETTGDCHPLAPWLRRVESLSCHILICGVCLRWSCEPCVVHSQVCCLVPFPSAVSWGVCLPVAVPGMELGLMWVMLSSFSVSFLTLAPQIKALLSCWTSLTLVKAWFMHSCCNHSLREENVRRMSISTHTAVRWKSAYLTLLNSSRTEAGIW